MTNRVVTMLPVSPRQDPALGFFLIPFLSHLVGRLHSMPVAGSLNVLGAKGHTVADAKSLQSLLDRLGIAPSVQWIDIDLPWQFILPPVFSKGVSEGWIRRDNVSVYSCPCGKTEFLDKPSNLVAGNFDRKVYEIRSGEPFCLLCEMPAVAKLRDTLLLILPQHAPSVRVIPNYADDTWRDLATNLSGREIPLNRVRATGLSVVIGGTSFNIDIDIAWMLHLFVLQERRLQAEILLCGHKTIKHVFMTNALSHLLGVQTPSIIVAAPYLTLDFGDREKLSAEDIVEKYGAVVARSLLLLGFGSTRKEVVVPSRIIHLFQHSVRVDPETLRGNCLPKDVEVQKVWRDFNAQTLQKAFAILRSSKPDELSEVSKSILLHTLHV